MGWRDRSTPSGIGPTEAHQLVEEGALLLDVRELEEWDAGHAPKARHLPLGELATRLDELPQGTPVVVVCRSGHRSLRATHALRAAGHDAVNLDGGMLAWMSSRLPIVASDGRPGTVS